MSCGYYGGRFEAASPKRKTTAIVTGRCILYSRYTLAAVIGVHLDKLHPDARSNPTGHRFVK